MHAFFRGYIRRRAFGRPPPPVYPETGSRMWGKARTPIGTLSRY